MTSDLLSDLNDRQREAVQAIDGPLLIVAGPGSGKTRFITSRIAYLMRVVGVSPARIAAVTFTNKAAREMKTRVESVAGFGSDRLTIGTFHAFCARMLRQDGEALGLDRNYVIYDDADQIDVIKRSMAEVEVDPKSFSPRNVQSKISGAKSQLLTADGFAENTTDYFEEVVSRVYTRYEELMAQSNAVDFDDLLLKAYLLLSRNEDVARRYQERFVHFMIDEFQDTNVAQYAIARLIAAKHRNLCVVGDPDQSIYSWRNADIRNILSFQKDFPDAKLIALEQNYRSTQNILDAAARLISANTQRVEKELFTQNVTGAPISVMEGYDEERGGAACSSRGRVADKAHQRRQGAISLGRHRRHVQGKRPVARLRGVMPEARRPVPACGWDEVLPAPGGEGPRRVPEAGRQLERRCQPYTCHQPAQPRHRSPDNGRAYPPSAGPRLLDV